MAAPPAVLPALTSLLRSRYIPTAPNPSCDSEGGIMATSRAVGLVVGFAFVLSGCGTFIDGKLYAIEQGTVWPLEVQISRGHGEIRASDPATGERFQGTYSGVRGGAVGVGFAGGTTAFAGASRTDVPAIATMIGDRGSVLDCEMLIQAGLRPHGFGTCKDKQGRVYRLQF